MNYFEKNNLESSGRMPDIEQAREKNVEVRSGGRILSGCLFFPQQVTIKEKNPGTMFLQGWLGDKEGSFGIARRLADQGMICLTVDLSGHGKSEGNIEEFARKDFLDDAVAAYDFLLHTDGVDPDNINVVGSSFGAYIGALLPKERAVKAMAFRVPADYPDNGFNEPKLQTADQPGVMDWRSRVRDFQSTESLRRFHNFSGPVLVVESEQDSMVPHGTIQSYINAAPDRSKVTHVVMKGAPHSLSKTPALKAEYEAILSEWFLGKNKEF